MPGEGKPKSRTEKREVAGFPGAGSLDGLSAATFFMAIFTNWLPKKGEPVSGFGSIVASRLWGLWFGGSHGSFSYITSWEAGSNRFGFLQFGFVDLIRADSRFFSGILHPHLLGDCRPNLFLLKNSKLHHPNQRAAGKQIEKRDQIRVGQMDAAAGR
jgi:hypothetical protein